MTVLADRPDADRFDARRARTAQGLLREFNRAGVLTSADCHVAATLGRLGGERDQTVLLAAALAARAPRLDHVCVDLAGVRSTVTADDDEPVDLGALPWPPPGDWVRAVGHSPLVAEGAAAAERPLRLDGGRLYLDRFWRYERRVAEALRARSDAPAGPVDAAMLRAGLDRLFPAAPDARSERPDRQRLAAAVAVLRRLAVVAGGPGTGKTTTVAKIVALLAEQAADTGQPPRVALAAPTGKAAARLEEALREQAAALPVDDGVTDVLLQLSASTIHRLLGSRPDNATRFRRHARAPLPHDLVVVDETSMVSLALMAKLLDAVRPDARIVLLGDPQQLASVEAGAVLGDIVGPVTGGLRMRPDAQAALEAAVGETVPASQAPRGVSIGDGIVVLQRVHRFRGDSGIAAFAGAVQRGDADAAEEVLRAQRPDLDWIPASAALPGEPPGPPDSRRTPGVGLDEKALTPVRAAVVDAAGRVVAAARAGDPRNALDAAEGLRVLCAHRRGPAGVSGWVPRIEAWLTADLPGFNAEDRWYLGRPVLVTRNDYRLGVFNGDVGVVVTGPDGRRTVAFRRADGRVRLVAPTRLDAVETVHAMTVHKSQGSQFRSVVVVLPDAESPILTRELLYTAATRARESLTVVGSPGSVRAAVARPVQRASGLRDALWAPS